MKNNLTKPSASTEERKTSTSGETINLVITESDLDPSVAEPVQETCCERLLGYLRKKSRQIVDHTSTEVADGSVPINKMIKILLLGPGNAGKSTILKQMRLIHGKNYTNDERLKYKPVIIKNIVDSLVNLANVMHLAQIEFDKEVNKSHLVQLIQFQQQSSTATDEWDKCSAEYLQIFNSIWFDNSIQLVYQNHNHIYLNDSIEFFINNLERICAVDYLPSIDDILRVRQPTTSIIEYTFKISGAYFLFVDVGGQRSERRKWIHCFENITSLLFVASLSDYDLKMTVEELKATPVPVASKLITLGCDTEMESMQKKQQEQDKRDELERKNRMREAIDLFHTIINWKKKTYQKVKQRDGNNPFPSCACSEQLLFDQVSIILFLNKLDLFEQKFKKRSLRVCFDDYVDTKSSDDAKRFIVDKFLSASANNLDVVHQVDSSSESSNDSKQTNSSQTDTEESLSGLFDQIMQAGEEEKQDDETSITTNAVQKESTTITTTNDRKRRLYWHYTFALDRKNIEAVVLIVKDKIIQNMLQSMQL